ncbi:hypothetical protein PR048_005158 [Dryococelus australis]|uniref:Integrase catalytic domain-containing protein n=1 Tax=Dryococelus australis TaxID=614101 RepID=A0ABQ9I7F7_9NEOP|nr:hypothetical protein PR048_005158 [Dryococelus australis]
MQTLLFYYYSHADLIGMLSEPDGDYKFILNYEDHLKKVVVLQPLKTKTADEVADDILNEFRLLRTPNILISDNVLEFRNKNYYIVFFIFQLIESLVAKWNGIKIVHGKPRNSQSQGSVERAYQDFRDSLVAWIKDNNTSSWVSGLRIVQSSKNSDAVLELRELLMKLCSAFHRKMGCLIPAFHLMYLKTLTRKNNLSIISQI